MDGPLKALSAPTLFGVVTIGATLGVGPVAALLEGGGAMAAIEATGMPAAKLATAVALSGLPADRRRTGTGEGTRPPRGVDATTPRRRRDRPAASTRPPRGVDATGRRSDSIPGRCSVPPSGTTNKKSKGSCQAKYRPAMDSQTDERK